MNYRTILGDVGSADTIACNSVARVSSMLHADGRVAPRVLSHAPKSRESANNRQPFFVSLGNCQPCEAWMPTGVKCSTPDLTRLMASDSFHQLLHVTHISDIEEADCDDLDLANSIAVCRFRLGSLNLIQYLVVTTIEEGQV